MKFSTLIALVSLAFVNCSFASQATVKQVPADQKASKQVTEAFNKMAKQKKSAKPEYNDPNSLPADPKLAQALLETRATLSK